MRYNISVICFLGMIYLTVTLLSSCSFEKRPTEPSSIVTDLGTIELGEEYSDYNRGRRR